MNNKTKLSLLLSYWQVFRVIFVCFFLYLTGDVLYRWDGFKYYGSFYEFLPSVALISIIWSIVAILTAMIICMFFRVFETGFSKVGWKVRTEHLLLCAIVFMLLGVVVWIGKKNILHHEQMKFSVKVLLFLFVTISSLVFTWISRYKSEQWFEIIQMRITPLVWLFGMVIIISLPIVAYQIYFEDNEKGAWQNLAETTSSDKNRPNIILVTFDTLTARNMSAYGYNRLTTPFLSEWKEESSFFTNVKAASNWTPPTVASLMTGKRVWTHQVYHLDSSKPVNSHSENLPLLMKNNGYTTMAFVLNKKHASPKALGIFNSFSIVAPPTDLVTSVSWLGNIDDFLYDLFGDKIRLYDWLTKRDFIVGKIFNMLLWGHSVTGVPPEKAFDSFLKTIDKNSTSPFFAWIHLYPPHEPYLPTKPYMGMFDSSSRLRTNISQSEVMMRSIAAISNQYPSQEVPIIVESLKARYDEFIRYCDKQFEEFIDELNARNQLKNTVVILSSDHGETFEHGYVGHNGDLYEQETHIPLIIREPGQDEGKNIDALIDQVDIPATILDFAGIPMPGWMEGRSVVPLIRDEPFSEQPAFSMNFQSNYRGNEITIGGIAVWRDDYKLIHNLKSKKSRLFNLKKDPDELHNLMDKEPDTGQRLLGIVQENLERANERIRTGE